MSGVDRPRIRLDRNELHIGPAPACLAAAGDVTAAMLHGYASEERDGAYSPLTRRLAASLRVDERCIGVGHDGEEGLLGQMFDLAAISRNATGRNGAGIAVIPDVSWPHYLTLGLQGCARISVGTAAENEALRGVLVGATAPQVRRGRADLLPAYR